MMMILLLFMPVSLTLASSTDDDFVTKIIESKIEELEQNIIVNSSIQYIFRYRNVSYSRSGLRVFSASEFAQDDQPVIVVVRQQKGVVSWQIPFYVRRDDNQGFDKFYSVNRTLCPISNNPQLLASPTDDNGANSDVYISVSTSSPWNLSFSIMLYVQQDFHITQLDRPIHAQVSPSGPIFFQVNLPKDEMTSVLVRFTSNDPGCAILSVQNITCPVYDLDRNVQFDGLYQTVDAKAGLTFSQDQFPQGVYVVIVGKTDDLKCRQNDQVNLLIANDKVKDFSLELTRKITQDEYLIAIFGAMGMFLGFYMVVLLISCVLCIKDYKLGIVSQEDQTPIISTIEISTEVQEEVEVNEDRIEVVLEDSRSIRSEDSSIDETDIDFLQDAEQEKDVFRTKTFLYLSDLARKSPRVLAKKSSLYNWNLMTIAIFYGLPVVQLVLTYQNVTNSTGNQDMCYFNFLCAHPLGAVGDFNHVFSNLGYVMLGILFILIVSRKDYLQTKLSLEHRKKYGVPQHFGMYYAMGLALIMEGIMSGCYHVCPNHTNFQFDTAFMYTISILILLKIYQTRHPDINANAYTAFGVLAFIIFIGVIGVLHGNVYFWIFFTFLHCLSCLILSFQIYYMGRWKVNAGIFKRIWLVYVNDVRAVIGGNWRGLKPMYVDRLILLLVLNAANWGLSGYGLAYLSDKGADFASFLLAIFIANVMLYTAFYIVMKLRYRERIGAQPATYIFISTFTWLGSLYFFLNKSTSWTKTPAESRELNQDCKLFHFYDNHDIWHFLSAMSLFLSFMILLTLDDDLEAVPRDKIPVF